MSRVFLLGLRCGCEGAGAGLEVGCDVGVDGMFAVRFDVDLNGIVNGMVNGVVNEILKGRFNGILNGDTIDNTKGSVAESVIEDHGEGDRDTDDRPSHQQRPSQYRCQWEYHQVTSHMPTITPNPRSGSIHS